jgi:predicted extracellular nuclease
MATSTFGLNDSNAQNSDELGPVRIHEIQGAAHRSPLVGQQVNNVAGIVTVLRSNGFYLQDSNPDGDEATSEGIFVFTNTRPNVQVGDSVQVSGPVVEFRPGNDANNLTTTQIGDSNQAAMVNVLSSNNPLPAPTVIGQGGRVAPQQAIEDDAVNDNVENAGTLFDPANDGIDFYESLEGMQVQINQAVAVGPTNSFGEIWVLPDNGDGATGRNERGGITIAPNDFNPDRVQIDDTLLNPPSGGKVTPDANVGDRLSTLNGVLDYSFNNYEVLVTETPNVTSGSLQPETTNLTAGANQLTVATFNVENLDPKLEDINRVDRRSASNVNDDIGTGKFAALAEQIVNQLKSPDIIGLQEIQDNDGAELSDVVDASLTYQTLIDAIAAAGGPRYAVADIPPGNGENGGQPGGNIRTGFLYQPDRVSLNSVNLIDPENPAFADSRKPLAGEFFFQGNKVNVVVNHFNSKGGDQPLFGPNQPPALTSEAQRIQQAQIVNDYVDGVLAGDANANVIVLGDLNDFQFSEPLNVLRGIPNGEGTPILTTLVDNLPPNERYTYVFQGNSQVLDHILVSDRLKQANAEVDVVHTNSEFADQATDHDPVVSRFTFSEPIQSDGPKTLRFSQFNASLNRSQEGDLVRDLSTPDNAQAKAVAEIIQRSNPDVLLLNEFDYVAADPLQPVRLFQQNYLSVGQNGANPVEYPYVYIAPSNTGLATGLDLNNNGTVVTTPGAPGYGDDAFGFGNFPGQFGMVLFSKYPIDTANIRTFQNFLWKDMPGSLLPTIATPDSDQPWYSPEEQAVLRLSSKSHWDVPINVNGKVVHALVSHPTPPVFDGPEDRNGKRNHDEIRFWSDYVTAGKGDYIYDDAGKTGGLQPGSSFVIMGDQNADPFDGDSFDNAIQQLLQNPNINANFIPTSPGGPQQAELQGGANQSQRGNPAFDTADFADTTPGNLRTDYVLPSTDLPITDSRVFWPANDDPLFRLVGTFDPNLPGGFPSSDHRLVWADVQVSGVAPGQSIASTEFAGQVIFPTNTIQTLNGVTTQIGGLSGVTYDAASDRYYLISDDRGDRTAVSAPAAPPPGDNIAPRFYTAQIDLSSGQLPENGVTFTDVTFLRDSNGNLFPPLQLDPEDIALTRNDTVFVTSEGEVNLNAGRVTNPVVNEFSLGGQQVRSLTVPPKFLPVVQDTNSNGVTDAGDTQTSGVRNNLAFESLTITPDQRYLFTATENALAQDGPVASVTEGSRSRILQYNLVTGQPEKEYLYLVDPVATPPNPSTASSNNGLVDLLAIDDRGTFLALERSFSSGVPGTGNTIKIYEVSLQGATDISSIESLNSLSSEQLAAINPVQKRLILNLDSLQLPTGTDNIEGLEFGPKLPDGRQSIVLVSDNNFSATQFTQILALEAPIGLNENLPIANGKINANLLQGDYVATETYGWTEFDIDPQTQKLTDTTYGIPFYTEAELQANPAAVTSRTPTIVSQFEVNPALLGDSGDNQLSGTAAADTIKGLAGRDHLLGQDGNDVLSGGQGDDVLRGGAGADTFILATGEGSDRILDFSLGEGDWIGLAGELRFEQLVITPGQGETNTVITLGGETLATLVGIQTSTLTGSTFTSVRLCCIITPYFAQKPYYAGFSQ